MSQTTSNFGELDRQRLCQLSQLDQVRVQAPVARLRDAQVGRALPGGAHPARQLATCSPPGWALALGLDAFICRWT
jgi:hypothetical protein